MIHLTCKCGYMESWCSGMIPDACRGCPKCDTVAGYPDQQRVALPHKFTVVDQVETDEGLKPLSRCQYCHRTRAELVRLEAAEHRQAGR